MSKQRTAAPRKDANGTWSFVADVEPGPKGERRQVRRRGFPTRKAAQEALDKLRVTAREGAFVAHDRQRLGEYLTTWIESLKVAGLEESTIKSYSRNMRLHVTPYIGGIRLQALTAQHLDVLYATLLAEGWKKGGKPRGLSPRTVRYIATILKSALSDAVRKDLIVRNVADAATPPSAKSARAPEMRFWTPGELQAFLLYMAEHRHFALFRLAAMTGMRRGEVCGLKWDAVDLEAGVVHVRRQLVVVEDESGQPRRVVLKAYPKSDAGRRAIDIDDATVAALRKQKVRQAEHRLVAGGSYRDDGFVFTEPDGSHLHPERVGECFDWHHPRAGVPRIRFHDIRHTHCAHLIAAGQNVKEISRRMGHASVAFTLDRYGHLMPESGSKAASAVAALVDGSS